MYAGKPAASPKSSASFRSVRPTSATTWRRWQFDVKTIHRGVADHYRSAWARDMQSGAVEHRAQQVDTDYRRHARELDAAHSAPGTAPIADRLQQLGPARGLVSARPRVRGSCNGVETPSPVTSCGHSRSHHAQKVPALFAAGRAPGA